MRSLVGVLLIGLGRLKFQVPHGLKFEPRRVRMFHSLTSVTGWALNLLPSGPQFEPNIGKFN